MARLEQSSFGVGFLLLLFELGFSSFPSPKAFTPGPHGQVPGGWGLGSITRVSPAGYGRRRLGVEHGSTELEIWAPEPAFGGGSFEAIIPTFAAQLGGISPPSYSIVAGLCKEGPIISPFPPVRGPKSQARLSRAQPPTAVGRGRKRKRRSYGV